MVGNDLTTLVGKERCAPCEAQIYFMVTLVRVVSCNGGEERNWRGVPTLTNIVLANPDGTVEDDHTKSKGYYETCERFLEMAKDDLTELGGELETKLNQAIGTMREVYTIAL